MTASHFNSVNTKKTNTKKNTAAVTTTVLTFRITVSLQSLGYDIETSSLSTNSTAWAAYNTVLEVRTCECAFIFDVYRNDILATDNRQRLLYSSSS